MAMLGSGGSGNHGPWSRPGGISPRIKLDRGGSGPPARQPRHKVANILCSVHPVRHRGQQHGQLPCDVVLRPVGRLVAQAEIDVVHLSLPQAPHRAGAGRPVVVAAQLGVRPPRRRAAVPPDPAGAGPRPDRPRCQPRAGVPLRRSRRLAVPARQGSAVHPRPVALPRAAGRAPPSRPAARVRPGTARSPYRDQRPDHSSQLCLPRAVTHVPSAIQSASRQRRFPGLTTPNSAGCRAASASRM
jgi:hypothetical protein